MRFRKDATEALQRLIDNALGFDTVVVLGRTETEGFEKDS